MSKVRITKKFRFEAAHALFGYDGKCKNIHGHNYNLFVTVVGKPISNLKNVKLGMVMDFGAVSYTHLTLPTILLV